MIVFEDKLAQIVELLPDLTVGEQTASINFNWGTESVLAKYLALSGKLSFPLIWLVEGTDNNDLREPNVSRNARIVILNESQCPDEFNPYQHEYDYKLILQPILDNLITALIQSGISLLDESKVTTQRIKNYSQRDENSLVYICNAIVLDATITFTSTTTCLNTIIFN